MHYGTHQGQKSKRQPHVDPEVANFQHAGIFVGGAEHKLKRKVQDYRAND